MIKIIVVLKYVKVRGAFSYGSYIELGDGDSAFGETGGRTIRAAAVALDKSRSSIR